MLFRSNDTATTEIYTLSLHDALPIYPAYGVLERDFDRQQPLRRADIRWATDPECSYRQHLAYDPRQGLYVGDNYPQPCQDYFGF